MDILNRESQKHIRDAEKVEEYTISTLVRAGMKEYTKNLQHFIQDTDSKLASKQVLEAMYQADESALALVSIRTILQVLMSSTDGRFLLSSLSSIVSKSVLHSKTLESLEIQHKALSNYIDKTYKRASDSKRLKAKMRTQLNLVGETREQQLLEQGNIGYNIGTILIKILTESIDIIEIIKLDSKSSYRGVSYPKFKPLSYLVQFTDECRYAILDLEASAEEFLKANVPPVMERPELVTKWYDRDANLMGKGRPNTLIKMPKRKSHLKDYKHVLDKADISGFNKIHHMIEGTQWTINEDVKKVIKEVFSNNMVDTKLTMSKGEHYEFNPQLLGGLPRRYNLEPDNMIQKSKFGKTVITDKGFEMYADGELEGLNRYNSVKNDLLAFNEKNLNKALSLQAMLNMSDDYTDKKFYFTYQYDTRSRIYPVQSVLNPQSDKKGKALLKFANGRKLTEEGHYWAKIHGANSWGMDKEELDFRVEFIDGMLDDIISIGTIPLMNVDKWCYTDDPYGFLAWCIEYTKVLKNPDYPYALATALDATCSGIQIYSGLLRDREGALAVNVIGNKRSDIYSLVANIANCKLIDRKYERYAIHTNANGEETTIDYRIVGDSLAGNINRSISKRNTMTQPYSVTMRGMQEQLKETFTEIEETGNKFWRGEIWQVSRLLAGIHQESIDEVVEGAKKGKEFIKTITELCAKKNKGILFTTDIGFPVYQKNVKSKSIKINSYMWTPDRGAQRIQFRVDKKIGKINTHSQKNSSAPNVIHSLDSTLLHRTVEGCYNRGVRDFALIHDSYGVHPNDVPILNEEVREAFIKIFSKDVLYDWAIEVLSNAGYSYNEMASIFEDIENPMIDTLDLNEVRNATYVFS